MSEKQHYVQPKDKLQIKLNQWDIIILLLFFGLMTAILWGAGKMATPFIEGEPFAIELTWTVLPEYSLYTIIRMAIALFFSFLFTFTIGTLAAKNRRAEAVILPFIDIMQSVPILGFLSISVMAFIYLFPGSRLGPECAAIFVIFTSQVWNMALSFYQSLKTLPKDLNEVARMYHLNPWQKFWRLEVPFAVPSLLWNTMMSLSAGWFFVVASEAISVANHQYYLPGIGSFIMKAQEQANYGAIGLVIMAMLIVIIGYDQLIFRPLLVWSEKFKSEPNEEVEAAGSWFLDMLQESHVTKVVKRWLSRFKEFAINPKSPPVSKRVPRLSQPMKKALSWTAVSFWNLALFASVFGAASLLGWFTYTNFTLAETLEVFYLGLVTTFKVAVLIILSSLVWVPIGVWIGLHPKWAARAQPLVQFFAAFPANLVYPFLFMLIITYDLNVEIWTSPLMILGTQWYILFNVIAGAMTMPLEIRLAAKNYQVRGWLWWKKVILPAIFPFYVTGAMTAAGGCWNASIIADVVKWGDETLHATGLGGYITEFTEAGDFPRIALGIAVMCLYVFILNRTVWHKLYNLAQERYHVG